MKNNPKKEVANKANKDAKSVKEEKKTTKSGERCCKTVAKADIGQTNVNLEIKRKNAFIVITLGMKPNIVPIKISPTLRR